MSSNKKKRLSLYDFFGKSSESSTSSSKNTKKHQRSSSDTSKSTTAKAKASHRLTFQIPDETIVSNIDMSKIPIPDRSTIEIKKRYAGLQNNSTPSMSSKGSTINKTNTSLNIDTSISSKEKVNTTEKSPVDVLSPESLGPEPDENEGRQHPNLPGVPPPPLPLSEHKPGPYSRLHSGASQSKGNRQVSNTSLSSSVYPNDPNSPIVSTRNGSNSTLPDFSRQTSSIYPPSTYNHDMSYNQGHDLKTSSTIKRTDLLKKRRPPPLSLKVNTQASSIYEPQSQDPYQQDPRSAAETIKVSASQMSATSTESGFTPLNIIPHMKVSDSLKIPTENRPAVEPRRPTEYSSTDSDFSVLQLMPVNNIMNNNPLAPEKQINPYKFENSGAEYEPPNFFPHEYANDSSDNNNNNIHKHSRTLSSIEEITSALDNFQIEHERSFNNTTESFSQHEQTEEYTDDVTGNTFSFSKSENNTTDAQMDVNLSCDLETHDVETNNDDMNTSTEKQDDDALIVKVKDLPQLENGETLDQYISKLKTKVKQNSTDSTNSNNSNLLDLTQPKFMNHKSEASSGSEIFYDAVDNSFQKNSDEEESDAPAVQSLDDDNSDSDGDDLPIINVVDNDGEDYLGDDQLDEGNDSFDSYVQKVVSETASKDDSEIEKFSEAQTLSTETSNIPRDIVADDGVWQRYSSATNFFNNAEQLDANSSSFINNSRDSNNTDDLVDANGSFVLTPTENKEFVNMNVNLSDVSNSNDNYNNKTPTAATITHRDFDLGDELDNNVTAIEPEQSSTKSFEDLYPTNSGEEDDFNDDDEDDDSDDDNIEQGDYHFGNRYGYDDDESSEESNVDNVYIDDDRNMADDIDNSTTDNNDSRYDDGVLEFSPRSQRSLDSIDDMAKTPDIFRHNSMCSRGLLEQMTGVNVTGTPTGLGIGIREHLVVTNQELDPLEETEFQDSIDEDIDEVNTAPIPDIESSSSSRFVERDSIDDREVDSVGDIELAKDYHQNIYDRREDPTVMPIQHSMVVTPAAPISGVLPAAKTRRPPPNYASTGRRGRGLSETTANPEMFMTGITQQLKVSSSGTGTVDSANPLVNSGGNTVNKEVRYSNENGTNGDTVSENTGNDIESRKGEKCTYIESLRLKSRKSMVNTKPSLQVLPIAIRQNGTISHKKIPSQQLFHSFKSHKHVTVKPKTRMLASEIDDAELPDATMLHRGQKTKVPIHPDADVIAASEQFNKLAKRQSGDLGRQNSVLSVRPHYGNGMRLFITNPDSDDE